MTSDHYGVKDPRYIPTSQDDDALGDSISFTLDEKDQPLPSETSLIVGQHTPFCSKKRAFIALGILFGAILVAVAAYFVVRVVTPPMDPTDPLERALYLQSKYPLVDTHNDLPWEIRIRFNSSLQECDISQRQNETNTDIPRLRAGEVGGQFWSVYVPCGPDATKRTLEQISLVYQMLERYPNDLEFVTTSSGITKAFNQHKIASLIGMEGGHSINSSIAILRVFYYLGARYMTLTHNCNTPWAEAANNSDDSYPDVRGLTELGVQIVQEMNKLGMMVDLSHVAPETMTDALDNTSAPVIFSHSGARALCDHVRNVPDEILVRMQQNGGVVMVPFVPMFLTCSLIANISDVADHIDYIKKVAGIDHVGYGSDFDGTPALPIGLEDVSTYPSLTAELIRREYSDGDIRKVIGGNIIRVLATVEQVSQQLKSVG